MIRPFMPLLTSVLLALAACAGGVQAPSLAPRPIETRGVFAAPAEKTVPAAPADAAFDARVAAALVSANAGEEAYASALASARRLAPRAATATPGSDAWVAAQQALTTLEATLGPAATTLADLDALRLEASGRDVPLDTGALDAAYARVAEIEQRQRADYAALVAALPAR